MALEEIDGKVAELIKYLKYDDVVYITGDHGCDPTHKAHTDHTREYVPILAWSPEMTGLCDIGTRRTYADIAATVADLMGVPERFGAESFADQLRNNR